MGFPAHLETLLMGFPHELNLELKAQQHNVILTQLTQLSSFPNALNKSNEQGYSNLRSTLSLSLSARIEGWKIPSLALRVLG